MQYRFKWDPPKARMNLNKHGVSFRAAEGVFSDPMALTLFDEAHSWEVDETDEVIEVRIISAR